MSEIDFETVVTKFDKILERGLCKGTGSDPNGSVCVEQAVAIAMDLPFNDNPSCVEPVIATFKRGLNDSRWSSPEARARGLRDLGIAQIGSAGVVDPVEFTKKLSEKMIRVLIPAVFRKVFPKDADCLQAALKCEELGTASAAYCAASAAYCAASAAYCAASAAASAARAAARAAASAAASAASAARAAASAAASAARAARAAARAAASAASAAASAARAADCAADEMLILGARCCLEVLIELKSPGCGWIHLGGAK